MSQHVCHSCGEPCTWFGHVVEDHKGEFLSCEHPQRWENHKKAVQDRLREEELKTLHTLLAKYPIEVQNWLGKS